jgi:hypothetical protein
MHHPVFLAFHMAHLDPQDQSAVKRWSARIAGLCCSVALLLSAAMAVSLPSSQTGAAQRAGATAIAQVTIDVEAPVLNAGAKIEGARQ